LIFARRRIGRMNWTLLLIIALVLVVLIARKRFSLVPLEAARSYLHEGALVVDVRSTGEFSTQHLRGAVNLPLNELEQGAQRRVPDKNRILLLHCLSGTRSGIARRVLKSMGYTSVFNLGSYRRAQRVVSEARG
jgi:phage shock protein E